MGIVAGQMFGRLTTISVECISSESGGRVRKRHKWLCKCECGRTKKIDNYSLEGGATLSCGCLHKERARDAKTTHGQSGTRAHRAWKNMHQRCRPDGPAKYCKDWGHRGIRVCDRWSSFECFLEDMGQPPTNRHTLERKDTDGNYEPGNCEWATYREQMNNTRRNHVVTFNGQSNTLAEWSRITGIRERLIHARITRLGWSVERSLTTPAKPRSHKSPDKIVS